ncbi:DUF397 domain-containing protein [Streptomyces sp. G3]|uniref:DUF397 domain-containing protein n=1 Tax=unclassified Streptomyces TaxID=2593676 RepID=UPI0013C965BF|nr:MULTISPECIES: DUF397 domain-containing protein [unclassified Streptomyces]MCM1941929.1 DUF397 domain-containing protein [Streptomyces sp. G3]NDZ73103.1 DUF397 domain-containing protein [Streptomyces sp. SID10362]
MRGYDLTNACWRKSSYSGGSGGEDCLEVTDGVPGVIPVRDSKVTDGPVIVVGSAAWTEFVRGVVQSRGPGVTT